MMDLPVPSLLYTAARIPPVAIGLPLGLGLLSGYPTANVVRGEWYKNLRFPPGRPPRQVFPVVWPLLYLSMGYASHLIALTPASEYALSLYYTQLALNFLWTPLFFGLKRTGLALVTVTVMTGTTFCLTKRVATECPMAVYLLLPYCGWLTYATYLNAGIWWLNRGQDKRDC